MAAADPRSRARGRAAAAEQADIEGPLVDWRSKGHVVELVGTETLPGSPAHKLKVLLSSGSVRYVWVDAATGLVARTESTRRLRGVPLPHAALTRRGAR